jgi:regulator of protease activity HflC (stomatin/prohibitin superfamily)
MSPIIGQSEMDQLLSERDSVNRELRRIIDEPTEGPWGIRVERVEIKDVSLPESMKVTRRDPPIRTTRTQNVAFCARKPIAAGH